VIRRARAWSASAKSSDATRVARGRPPSSAAEGAAGTVDDDDGRAATKAEAGGTGTDDAPAPRWQWKSSIPLSTKRLLRSPATRRARAHRRRRTAASPLAGKTRAPAMGEPTGGEPSVRSSSGRLRLDCGYEPTWADEEATRAAVPPPLTSTAPAPAMAMRRAVARRRPHSATSAASGDAARRLMLPSHSRTWSATLESSVRARRSGVGRGPQHPPPPPPSRRCPRPSRSGPRPRQSGWR
jgi:hypothetical protein